MRRRAQRRPLARPRLWDPLASRSRSTRGGPPWAPAQLPLCSAGPPWLRRWAGCSLVEVFALARSGDGLGKQQAPRLTHSCCCCTSKAVEQQLVGQEDGSHGTVDAGKMPAPSLMHAALHVALHLASLHTLCASPTNLSCDLLLSATLQPHTPAEQLRLTGLGTRRCWPPGAPKLLCHCPHTVRRL